MSGSPCCPNCRASIGDHHAKTCYLSWGQVLPSECPGVIEATLVEILQKRLAAAEKRETEALKLACAAETLAADRARQLDAVFENLDINSLNAALDTARAERDAALDQVASLKAERDDLASKNKATLDSGAKWLALWEASQEQLAAESRRHVEALAAEELEKSGLRAQMREALSRHCAKPDASDSACACCQPRFRALAGDSTWLDALKERAVKAGVEAALRWSAACVDAYENNTAMPAPLDLKAIAAGAK
ncbi:MAG: hypothetical protein Q8K32_10955 [Archangium sp.]|nr:hypothetical protein [Archangium sp.]